MPTDPTTDPTTIGRHPRIRIATRHSALALVQTRLVADALQRAWPGIEVELAPVVTDGDRRNI